MSLVKPASTDPAGQVGGALVPGDTGAGAFRARSVIFVGFWKSPVVHQQDTSLVATVEKVRLPEKAKLVVSALSRAISM